MNRTMQALTWAAASSAFAYCFMLAAFDLTMPLAYLVGTFAIGAAGYLFATRGAR